MTPAARSTRSRRRRRAVVIAAAALLLLPFTPGCTMTLTPPVAPADPTTVSIIDYGRHASLALPADDGSLTEYTFGEWEWFALGRDHWTRAGGALLVPSAGALGRGPIPLDPTRADARPHVPHAQHVIPLRVDADRVRSLRARLDAEFDRARAAHPDTPVRRLGLEFVPTVTQYTLTHNCNHELALWLEDLGVGVSGSRMMASFRVARPARPPAAER